MILNVKIKENKYLNYLKRNLFPDYFEKPDSKKSFHLSWRNTVKMIKEKPDIIYSRSFPLSSTVLALKLKEHYDVPWVLHLSDPWAYCPITDYKSNAALEYHRNLERKCFEKADFICLTSDKTIDEYEFGDKIKIVYTGGLVDNRSVSYLIDALDILKKEHPQVLDVFEFIFAGAMDSYNKSFFEKSAFRNLRHIGLLPYNEALDLQRTADILLVIDNPIDNPDKAVFFPSKLLDYMLMQRNILAVTTLGGTSDDLLKSIGAISVSHSDQNGLVAALLNIHKAFTEKDKSFFFRKNIDERFSAEYNTKRLVETFESLLK